MGIDTYWSNLLARRALYLPFLIRGLVSRGPDVSFLFLDSTRRNHAPLLALEPSRRALNAERYQFHDLSRDLDRIASLDLVLSTRLHVGVAALSYGVTFVSLLGEPKTALFLHHPGLDRVRFTHANMLAFMGTARDRSRFDAWLRPPVPSTVQDAIDRSAGHLVALDSMLDSLT